jgi:hypothetical protein
MTYDSSNLSDTIISAYKNLGAGNYKLKEKCIVVYNMFFLGFLPAKDVSRYIEPFSTGGFTNRRLKKFGKTLHSLISSGVENMGSNINFGNESRAIIVKKKNYDYNIIKIFFVIYFMVMILLAFIHLRPELSQPIPDKFIIPARFLFNLTE